MTPFVWLSGSRTGFYWVWWVIMIIQVGLEAMAIKPLFAKSKQGWTYMFYAQLLSVVTSLSSMSVGSLLFTVVGFYLLYQVKSEYK